jgi:hypothetical protein
MEIVTRWRLCVYLKIRNTYLFDGIIVLRQIDSIIVPRKRAFLRFRAHQLWPPSWKEGPCWEGEVEVAVHKKKSP